MAFRLLPDISQLLIRLTHLTSSFLTVSLMEATGRHAVNTSYLYPDLYTHYPNVAQYCFPRIGENGVPEMLRKLALWTEHDWLHPSLNSLSQDTMTIVVATWVACSLRGQPQNSH